MGRFGCLVPCIALVLCSMAFVAEADSNCSTAETVLLTPCVTFVTGSSGDTPSSLCCSGLREVIDDHPLCVCEILTNNSLVSTFNLSHAQQLPSLCNVNASATDCSTALINGTANSPSSGPSSSPGGTTTGSPGSSDASTMVPRTMFDFLKLVVSTGVVSIFLHVN